MCLQPASQSFTPLLNNIVLSQSVGHVFTASFTVLHSCFKQHCPFTECGHVFTASFTELHWRFTAHHSTAPWAPFDSELLDIKVLGAVPGWRGGGGSTPCTPCTPCLTMLSLRSLMFTYTEGRPLSTRRETVTRTETRHPHRENRVPTPRDTFTHTKGKASPTQR